MVDWEPTGDWKRVHDDDLLWYAWGQWSDRELARKYPFLTEEIVREEGPPVQNNAMPIDRIVAREMERDEEDSG